MGGRGTLLSRLLLPGPWSQSFNVVPRNSVTIHPWSGGSRHAPIRLSTKRWRCRDRVSTSCAKKPTPLSLEWKKSGYMHFTATSRPRHLALYMSAVVPCATSS
nr:hypothetical protein Itr_chr14CG17460 [Ipomoea trifida]